MTSDRSSFPWVALLALAAGTMSTVTAELIPAGLLLEIAEDTGTPPSAVGQLITVWGLTIALLSLPLTWATRRCNRRTVLLVALLVTGGAALLSATADSFTVLIIARTVAAAAHGLFWALVVVTATSLVPEKQMGRAVAIVVAGPTLATVGAVPAGTALGEAISWRLVSCAFSSLH